MREKSEAINGISEGWQEILKTSVMQPFSSVLAYKDVRDILPNLC